MPILDHRNKTLAVIELLNKKSSHFNTHDEQVLGAFSGEVATALKRVALEKVFMDSGGDNEAVLGMIEQYSRKGYGQYGGKKLHRSDATSFQSSMELDVKGDASTTNTAGDDERAMGKNESGESVLKGERAGGTDDCDRKGPVGLGVNGGVLSGHRVLRSGSQEGSWSRSSSLLLLMLAKLN